MDGAIDNEEVIRKLGEQILNGDGRAMSLYFGYSYGKPKESVDISSTDGFNINFNDIIKAYEKNPHIKEMMLTGGSPSMHGKLVNELTHFANEHNIFITT